VDARSLGANEQLKGDFPVAPALCDKGEDLAFATCQRYVAPASRCRTWRPDWQGEGPKLSQQRLGSELRRDGVGLRYLSSRLGGMAARLQNCPKARSRASGLVEMPELLEGHDRRSPTTDKLVFRNRIDAGQPP
jgi:hypothetical protein